MRNTILPRVIRLRDAPKYLGMNKNLFNKEVRPLLNEMRVGKQGIALDLIDLDHYVEHNMKGKSKPQLINK